MLYSSTQCSEVLYTLQCCTALYTVQCSTVLYTIQCSTVLYTVQCSTVLYTVQCTSVLYTVQCSEQQLTAPLLIDLSLSLPPPNVTCVNMDSTSILNSDFLQNYVKPGATPKIPS